MSPRRRSLWTTGSHYCVHRSPSAKCQTHQDFLSSEDRLIHLKELPRKNLAFGQHGSWKENHPFFQFSVTVRTDQNARRCFFCDPCPRSCRSPLANRERL